MKHDLTKAQEAVLARRNADALYSNLDAEGRAEYAVGMKWAAAFGEIYTGPKLRGRPPGSRNRKAEVDAPTLEEVTS